jgi:galactosamine-6-phosphate isomerase
MASSVGAMGVEVLGDAEAVAARAADLIIEAVRAQPHLVLCAATGSTPTRTYELLAERAEAEPSLFGSLRVVKLDEWAGLAMDHPSTCEAYLQAHVLTPLAIPPERYLSFVSDAADPAAECRRVQSELDGWGGVGISLLGIGLNSHLGLNEPADALVGPAHVATLEARTANHTMLADEGITVSEGITLGMDSVLGSALVLLLVTGEHKAAALHDSLSCTASDPQYPASTLRDAQHECVCLCDEAAFAEHKVANSSKL